MREKGSSRFQNLINGTPESRSDDSTRPVDGEIVESSGTNEVGSSFSIAQKTSESILHLRVLMGQLIRGDDESKRLLLNYFREGVEEKYLDASIRTDQTRLNNLSSQMEMVNEGLSNMLGKQTTIVKVYKDISEEGSQYQPVLSPDGRLNPKGFFDFLKFHRELATQILSTSEIASESAEIEAQTSLVPLREELNRIVISEKEKTARELIDAGETLTNSEITKGEIRISKIRGMTTPIIITVAETPVILLQAPVDRLSKWMDEADDKAVPISAVGGAIAGPIILFTRIASSSPIIESWLSQNVVAGTIGGVFGGALVSVAAWGTVKNLLPAIKDTFDSTVRKLQNIKWK